MFKKLFILGLLFANISYLTPSYNTAFAQDKSIETTSVLSDLNEIAGFKIDSYSNTEFDLIYIAEHGYETNNWNKYNLYFYFYFNPKIYENQTSIYKDVKFNSDYEFNKINLKVNDDKINNVDISLVNYERNFYKFKIVDPLQIYRQNYSQRNYLVNEFIFTLNGFSLVLNKEEDFIVSYKNEKQFEYKGIYKDVDKFQVGVNGVQYLSLNVTGGSVNTGPSSEGIGFTNLLYYVWFSVPNEVLEDVGEINYIRYEREKYQLRRMYHLASYLKQSSFKNYYVTDSPSIVASGITDFEKYGGNGTVINQVQDFLNIENYRMYYNSNGQDIIDKQLIEENINKHGIKNLAINGYEDAYDEIVVHDDEFLDLLGMSPDSNSMMTNYFWSTFFGYDIKGPTITNLKAIEKIEKQITSEDDFVSEGMTFNKYVINKNDVDKFNNDYNDCQNNNESMYLFRFDVDPNVFSFNIFANQNKTGSWDNVGYATDTSAIINFKILEIGFMIDEKLTVLPILMDPINIIPDGTPPYLDWTNRNIFIAILSIVLIVLLIVLIIYVYPYIAPLFAAVGSSTSINKQTREINKQTRAINKQAKAVKKLNKEQEKNKDK